MIKLGESIDLEVFEDIDRTNMVVLKKILGNHVKNLQESPNFKKIKLTLNSNGGSFEITADLELEGKNLNAQSKEKNIFFSLNNVFDSLLKQVNEK